MDSVGSGCISVWAPLKGGGGISTLSDLTNHIFKELPWSFLHTKIVKVGGAPTLIVCTGERNE
jgi:hypothetical protein